MNQTTPTHISTRLQSTVPLLMLVVAFGHFNRVGISVVGAERIIPVYGLSRDRMGLVYSAFLVAYALMMVPGGKLIDRVGARAALVLQGFGSAFFVAISGLVGWLTQDVIAIWLGLLVVRALLGAVNAPLHPASARMVFDRVPPGSRSTANGLVNFSACLGIAVTYYLMGALIDGFGWQAALLISAGMTLVVALIWTAFSPSTRPNVDDQSVRTEHEIQPRVLFSRSTVFLTLSYTTINYFEYLFFYWIAYYFETFLKQDKTVARGYAAMITLAMGVGMIAGGWLTDRVPRSIPVRFRRALVPVLGMLASGLVFEVGLVANDPRIMLAAFALAAALIGACEGAFWTTAIELGGVSGGSVAGLMNMGGNIGGAISPYLTPLLGDYLSVRYGPDLGWRLSLAIAGGVVAAGALMWIGIAPAESLSAETKSLQAADVQGLVADEV
jgi:MFS family permease